MLKCDGHSNKETFVPQKAARTDSRAQAMMRLSEAEDVMFQERNKRIAI